MQTIVVINAIAIELDQLDLIADVNVLLESRG